MRKILLVCGIILACISTMFSLSSCCTKKIVTNTITKDSLITEVKTETVYVPDTVYLEVPAQKAQCTTADSTSHLETDFAKSDARINPDGTLSHSLENKPQNKPVEFQKPIEKRDSIVYKYKYINNDVVKEKELSKWERTKIDYGGTAIIIVLLMFVFIVYRIVRKFTIK